MVKLSCSYCNKDVFRYKSQIKDLIFCNKSCHRSFKNNQCNPSRHRDLSGINNPMYGKHPIAWNKGLKGELSHNWKGGIHTRSDGYVRIRIDGKRKLLHRHILEELLQEGNVVHHKDGNPSNNELSNLEILKDQSTHAKLHAVARHAKDNS